jgi:hypothetical protein
MNEILSFKASKSKRIEIFENLYLYLFYFRLATSCLDHALELVNNEILRLDSSMEKAGKLELKMIELYLIIICLAEAINRSFNEIKSYVENRRHNLLQSLKTTKDYKLKVLNDQLNLILSKSFFFFSFICFLIFKIFL